ncbi:MAG: HypC/HybG/HupF family hydrogenase formation chaperone [Sulfobacillus thermotolerans]|nr:HypC/HybG/HupF family hydrogenase formation chaperone [Sulfobacillus thermotolerans]
MLDESRCLVEGGGRTRHAFYEGIDDLREGDWVLIEANLVLEKLTEEEGQQAMREALRYVFGNEDEGEHP